MHNRKFTPEKPTTELFMDVILERETCRIHGADFGDPCGRMGPFRVVCNKRAVRAGFNHPIDPESLRRSQGKKK